MKKIICVDILCNLYNPYRNHRHDVWHSRTVRDHHWTIKDHVEAIIGTTCAGSRTIRIHSGTMWGPSLIMHVYNLYRQLIIWQCIEMNVNVSVNIGIVSILSVCP